MKRCFGTTDKFTSLLYSVTQVRLPVLFMSMLVSKAGTTAIPSFSYYRLRLWAVQTKQQDLPFSALVKAIQKTTTTVTSVAGHFFVSLNRTTIIVSSDLFRQVNSNRLPFLDLRFASREELLPMFINYF